MNNVASLSTWCKTQVVDTKDGAIPNSLNDYCGDYTCLVDFTANWI
jgi:hypothetical protein